MPTPTDALDAFLDTTGGERVRVSVAGGPALTGTLVDVEEGEGDYLGHGEYVEGARVATLETDGEQYALEVPLGPDGRPGDIALVEQSGDGGAELALGTVDGLEVLESEGS